MSDTVSPPVVDQIASSNAIVYDNQQVLSHPQYRFLQLQPNNFGQPIAINSSITNATINISSSTSNFSEGYIDGKLVIPRQAGNYIWYYKDIPTFGCLYGMQYYDQLSNAPVNIMNLQNYFKLITKKEMSLDEYLENADLFGLQRSNSLVNVVPALRAASAGVTALPYSSSLNYTEPAYFAVDNDNTGAGNFELPWRLPLKWLKNSFFAINKDTNNAIISYLKLFFGPVSKICYMSTSNVDPNLGTPTAYTGAARLEGLTFYQATEDNKTLADKIAGEVKSKGIEMFIPYIINDVVTAGGNNVQSVNKQLTNGDGNTLIKVIVAPFNQTESLNTAYDCDNSNFNANQNVQKIKQFITKIDSKNLQDVTVDCTQEAGLFIDYLNMRKQLKGSVIQNRNMYMYNWHWCDDFSGLSAEDQQKDNWNYLTGKPLLNSPITWTFQAMQTSGVAYNYYIYTIVSKKLRFTSTGMQLE